MSLKKKIKLTRSSTNFSQSESKKWTKRLDVFEKQDFANNIKRHRFLQLSSPSFKYSAARSASSYKEYKQDVLAVIKDKLEKRKGPLRILDSGAGLLNVSADIKVKFKNSVHVTGLTLRHPNTSLKSETIALNITKELTPENGLKRLTSAIASRIKGTKLTRAQLVEYHKKLIQKGRRNSKIVDKVKVGLIENQTGKEVYDVILDLHGPLTHTINQSEVMERYKTLLNRGGILITPYPITYLAGCEGFKLIQAHGLKIYEKL